MDGRNTHTPHAAPHSGIEGRRSTASSETPCHLAERVPNMWGIHQARTKILPGLQCPSWNRRNQQRRTAGLASNPKSEPGSPSRRKPKTPARVGERLDPASHPAWLTEEAYRRKAQPLVAIVPTFRISSAIGVTWAYSSNIRKGRKLPAARHWTKLAELVGVGPGR